MRNRLIPNIWPIKKLVLVTMKHRVTLKDIAQRLGITVTTVSKALKDYPDISKKTKEAVRELAAQLKYQPDSQALALRGSKSYTIGLIIPEIVHFFFSNVINGIMNYLETKGYRLLITLSNNSTELEAKQVNLLFGNKVDGVLVSLANETVDVGHFKLLSEYDIPLVMFDKVNLDFNCQKVIIDDVAGGYIATKHLISKGCKRIAHIRGPKSPLNAIGRYEGYLKALEEAGLDADPSLVKSCKLVNLEEGYEFAKILLHSPAPPDGIFAVTDQVAVGVLQAAKELGVKVPQKLKVVGFSDSLIAQVAEPALTTIHQPGYEIGEAAARMLIETIEIAEEKGEYMAVSDQFILPTYLIRRKSS